MQLKAAFFVIVASYTLVAVAAERSTDSASECTSLGCRFELAQKAQAPTPVTSAHVGGVSSTAAAGTLDVKRGVYGGERGLPFLHNNSWVWIFAGAGLIVYDKPSSAMTGLVRPGDVLFRGSISRDRIFGTAYAFKRGCPPLGYAVSGAGFNGDPTATVLLRGQRIVREGPTCALSEPRMVAEALEFDGEAGIGD